jgi:hypothetical protein
MANLRHVFRLSGVIACGLAIIASTAVAMAVAPAARPTLRQWQTSLAGVQTTRGGCYAASYPALAWRPTACRTAPVVPLIPRSVKHAARSGGPAVVGNGSDYSAVVNGTISQATGTFTNVSPNITETGVDHGQGGQVANAFTLQINSQFFPSPACRSSGNPSGCQGWEQFVYDTDGSNLFMQYWLTNYDATCPSGWWAYHSDCFTNGPAVSLSGGLTAAQLASVAFGANARAGDQDIATLSVGSRAVRVSNTDSVLDLAQHWNTTEFGVFGDADGGEANFGANTTLDARTTLLGTSQHAPSCVKEGFTGETNNLTLSGTAKLSSLTAPTVQSAQTNGTASPASCATLGAGPVDFYSGTDGIAGWSSPSFGAIYGQPTIIHNDHLNTTDVVAETINGGLDMFVNIDNQAGWTTSPVGGQAIAVGAPAVVHNSHFNTTEIATEGPHGTLNYWWAQDGSPGWHYTQLAPAGSVTSAPAIVHDDATNTTDIAVAGPGGTVVLYTNVDGLPGWPHSTIAATGSATAAPAMIYNRHFHNMEIAVETPSHALKYLYNSGSSWPSSLIDGPGTTYSAPAMVHNDSAETTEIAFEGLSGGLLYTSNGDGTPLWHPSTIAGAETVSGAPAIAYNSHYANTEIATRTPAGQLLYFYSTGSTWNPSQIAAAGSSSSAPAIIHNTNRETTEVVAEGPNT